MELTLDVTYLFEPAILCPAYGDDGLEQSNRDVSASLLHQRAVCRWDEEICTPGLR